MNAVKNTGIEEAVAAFHEAVGNGKASVLYVKPDRSDDNINIRFGIFADININNLDKTHSLLGSGDENLDPDDFFCRLQGERWSPNGEANPLIRAQGLAHTSMSVGDLIIYPMNNSNQRKVMVVANAGFVCLGFIEPDKYPKM